MIDKAYIEKELKELEARREEAIRSIVQAQEGLARMDGAIFMLKKMLTIASLPEKVE